MKGKALVIVEIEYEADSEKHFQDLEEDIKRCFYFGVLSGHWRYDRTNVKSVKKVLEGE